MIVAEDLPTAIPSTDSPPDDRVRFLCRSDTKPLALPLGTTHRSVRVADKSVAFQLERLPTILFLSLVAEPGGICRLECLAHRVVLASLVVNLGDKEDRHEVGISLTMYVPVLGRNECFRRKSQFQAVGTRITSHPSVSGKKVTWPGLPVWRLEKPDQVVVWNGPVENVEDW